MEILEMSASERRRLIVFSQVKQRGIRVAEAARSLGLSERQGRRLWKRYDQQGDRGLIHGLRGKPGNASHGTLREKVLAVYRQKYTTCNAAHAVVLLQAREKLTVSRKTLWRWLKCQGGVVQPRRHKPHRQRRVRRTCIGELVQMDGSTHRWFGEDLPECVLFVMIDDATGQVFARFYESEDTAAAFDLFGRYARGHGLPGALYVDHDSIYVVNESDVQAQRRRAADKPAWTQFGRAMEELSVGIIAANSPQAKGRVERVNRTLQDRLVKELALALTPAGRGLRDIPAANAFLDQTFLKAFNREFGKIPASGINVHRRVPAPLKLAEVLCHKESRAVGQDWCVQYAGRILQIPKQHASLALAGTRINVLEQAGGTLKLMHQGTPLAFTELASRPPKIPVRKVALASKTPWRPGPSHPWNATPACQKRRAATQQATPPGGENFRGMVKPVPLHSDSLRSASLRSTALTTPPPPRTLLLRR
jgi:transposase